MSKIASAIIYTTHALPTTCGIVALAPGLGGMWTPLGLLGAIMTAIMTAIGSIIFLSRSFDEIISKVIMTINGLWLLVSLGLFVVYSSRFVSQI